MSPFFRHPYLVYWKPSAEGNIKDTYIKYTTVILELIFSLKQLRAVTSGAGFGTRRPALQSPLVGVLLNDVVVVDRHRIFVNDVLVH